jgi:hypothetical protein
MQYIALTTSIKSLASRNQPKRLFSQHIMWGIRVLLLSSRLY